MRRSHIGLIAYVLVMFISLALTVTGMFTPKWVALEDSSYNIDKNFEGGLFELKCPTNNLNCDWWADMPKFSKVCFVAISLAVIIEVISLIFGGVAFCISRNRRNFIAVLIALSVIVTFLLSIVVTLYGTDAFMSISKLVTTIPGYSYWLVCGGLILAFLTIGFAIMAFYFANECDHDCEGGEVAYNW